MNVSNTKNIDKVNGKIMNCAVFVFLLLEVALVSRIVPFYFVDLKVLEMGRSLSFLDRSREFCDKLFMNI